MTLSNADNGDMVLPPGGVGLTKSMASESGLYKNTTTTTSGSGSGSGGVSGGSGSGGVSGGSGSGGRELPLHPTLLRLR